VNSNFCLAKLVSIFTRVGSLVRRREDRTNNHAEGAHRKVYATLGSNHPVIWKFIQAIRTVQRGRDAYYELLIAGKIQTKNSLSALRLMNAF